MVRNLDLGQSRAAALLAWPWRLLQANLMIVRYLLRRPIGTGFAAGDLLIVREPLATTVLTHWQAPFTDGFTCTLPAGTRLRVDEEASRWAKGLTCLPDDPAAFDRQLVPEATRSHPKYAGCSLVLFRREIASCDRGD